MKKDRAWSVYVLRCKNKSLYTGITNDIQRRLKMHHDGIASKYTRSRRPVKLVYQENSLTRSKALKREYAIKSMSKPEKECLVHAIKR